MDEDEISVISIECQTTIKDQKEDTESKEEIQDNEDTSAWNICHVFSVLTICVVFLVPFNFIPRANSIFYRSKWYEFNFVMMGFMLLPAANEILNMATFLKQKSFLSFRMLMKMYSFFIVAWTVPYLIAYLIWCQYLEYNWPIPFLGYNYILFQVVRPVVTWISFPRNLRKNKDVQQNFRWYCLLLVNAFIRGVLLEGISFLFIVLPRYMQWIVALVIPLLKQLEIMVQSKVVNKMTGGQEEASKVFLALDINPNFSFFIATRLPNAEIITTFFFIAVDFFLQLKMTYEIVRMHNMVNDETVRKGNIEKKGMLRKLALAEITEGMTPIAYAIGFFVHTTATMAPSSEM